MSNLLTGRLRVPTGPLPPESKRTPVALVDGDGWPIRVGAKITVRRNGRRTTGEVLATYLDHRSREVVAFSVQGSRHHARPGDCRVQYRKGTR